MEKTVCLWMGHEYIEWILENIPDDWTEDEIYEAAVEAVYNNISIEVL